MINIDLIVGPVEKEERGISYYVNGLCTTIKNYVSIKIITYDPISYSLKPFFNLVYYPKIIQNKRRPNAIAHITHQGYAYLASLLNLQPFIVTCHDIIPLIFYNNIKKLKFRYAVSGIKNADKIIADSYNTKQDIISYFKIPDEKIKIIPLAADKIFQPLDEVIISKIKQKYNFDFPLILYVGTLEPRKNIPTLIKAFCKLKKEGLPHILLVTGKKDGKYKKIFEMVKKLNLQKDVIFTGYIPREDLPTIYNAVDLFVYPSLYEGFSLPPLEAMACGTPVITSNTSSLPEVVGDAGIMVNPYEIDGLAKAMYEVLTDCGLREDMIKKGLKRAKMFSWERTAKETLEVYQEVYYEN